MLRGELGVLTATGDVGHGQIPFVDEEMQSLASSLMRGVTSRGGFNYWDKRALKVPSPPLVHTPSHTHTHTHAHAHAHGSGPTGTSRHCSFVAWQSKESARIRSRTEIELAWWLGFDLALTGCV